MWLASAIMRQVQVFVFAFSLAAGALMCVGVASGKLERGETYVKLSGQFATILVKAFPQFAAHFPGGDAKYADARLAGANGEFDHVLTPLGPNIRSAHGANSSLQALRSRQTQVPLHSQ